MQPFAFWREDDTANLMVLLFLLTVLSVELSTTASAENTSASRAFTNTATTDVSRDFNATGNISAPHQALTSVAFNATVNSSFPHALANSPIANESSALLCGNNERLAFCHECEHTCPGVPPVPCSAGCRFLLCYCDPDQGFARDQSGSCVPRSECPNQCGPNEVYRKCRTCEGCCVNGRRLCQLICRGPGCECPFSDGYVRDSSGDCIPSWQCPVQIRTTTRRVPPPSGPCAFKRCPPGQHCVLVFDIFCFIPPCRPVPECVDL
ncbi:hypothetical protein Tcan_09797 [Toxocara canis]|uniref:TIL domain-containing protein n=1 Tax=Toxocara canis TaxID=6265 RepID=A0A0B2VVA4_TOXCA|nr:hypothetical protein Tcan_09797 [Toxocara canis]